MRTLMLLLGVCVIILTMSSVFAATESFRSASLTEQHDITTGVGENTTSVALTQALYSSTTANATVTSNITADAPIASSYTSSGHVLVVSGLSASNTRRLTIIYKYGTLGGYPGVDTMASMWLIFLGLGVLGVVAGAIYSAFRERD